MRWSTWKTIFARKAEPSEMAIGRLVYFSRGALPELGKVVAAGDEIRVPLMRCSAEGRVSTRRTYMRNRSQLYVRKDGAADAP